MDSWFNIDSLKSLTEKVNAESIKEFTERVQSALPKIDDSLIEKLTLTSPELAEERRQIDNEERAKEACRNSLAGLLPWETRDPDRDILVDECRDAILKLSRDRSTFSGPYPMPKSKISAVDNEQSNESHDNNEPSQESKEKLEKLEPLPKHLQNFSLDAHVGLIERLLKEDPNLVKVQMSLSAGGERERTFWRNYFFHCAYTRYEAGLSIDEIWSDDPLVFVSPIPTDLPGENDEETIIFQETVNVKDMNEPKSDQPKPASHDAESNVSDVDVPSDRNDFEMVGETEGDHTPSNDGDDDDLANYELDELEAEIARELED
ncbi:hypothetical protein FisN_4Lh345 [Fistulifera solaris]|uniref:BSD domain-containing protein n=1 Tax=Fistulifera solaris TaxID=1519565 RepID=A0A1Z5JZF3_FISSO|nr:hypothetical protein FisN_4Lh345 [Fistulifera solaris]|eukprot:GAX19367.1 hypothetical protein FisN_4Lh345 [Fistulifera solaris]